LTLTIAEIEVKNYLGRDKLFFGVIAVAIKLKILIPKPSK